MSSPRKRESIWAGVLLIFTTAIAVCSLELAVRSLYESPQAHVYPQVRYVEDSARFFTLKPNQVAYTYDQVATIMADGFRSNGHGFPTSRQCTTLFALGDSFTFGLGVSDSETWPAILEQLTSNLCVINGGTASYDVREELTYFKEYGLSTKPTIVVHALYWNDYMDRQDVSGKVLTNDGHFIWHGDEKPSFTRWIRDHSTVAFLTSTLIRKAITPRSSGLSGYAMALEQLRGGSIDEVKWDRVRQFYKEMKGLALNHKFSLAVIIMPVRGIAAQPEHQYPSYVRKLLQECDVPYVDAFEIWEKRGLRDDTFFLPYDEHLTADGYRIIAQETSTFIKRLVRFNQFIPFGQL